MSSTSTSNNEHQNPGSRGSGSSNPNLGLGLGDIGITPENIKSLQHNQELEQWLPQLLKGFEFWELENKFIYELSLSEPYMTPTMMEDALLDWISLDIPRRRQYFDKLCELIWFQQQDAFCDLLEKRNVTIEKLEEKVKLLDQALEEQKKDKLTQIAKNEKMRREIKELDQALEKEEKDKLAQIAKNEQKRKVIKDLDNIISRLDRKIEDLKTKNDNLYEQIDKLKATEAGRVKQVEERRELLGKMQSQKLQQLEEITLLNQELITTKQELEKTTAELRDSQQTCSATETKLKEVSAELEELKKKTPTKRSNQIIPAGAGDAEVPSKKAKTNPSRSISAVAVLGCSTSNTPPPVTQNLTELFGDDFNTSSSSQNKLKIDLDSHNWQFHTLKQDGEMDKKITEKIWKPEYSPYFRELEISDILHGLNIYEVLSSLAPQITLLNFLNENHEYEWISDATNGEKLLQFLDKFRKSTAQRDYY